ncbi:anti-sigma factor antagonist [Mycolicibacter heraklionensis]|uniref:Anti-sigma factor antagonist n=1 Tax=Mycolicibacter heraklionensis TaxID=512402 RepID=A0A9X7ZFD1_9MYCO|nr:anti-sigma factor antagonist [Mycolicibacter heraklionensis]QZA06635.1 anti-sigma factor antagonist [Mycolicibacter heraklionensis]
MLFGLRRKLTRFAVRRRAGTDSEWAEAARITAMTAGRFTAEHCADEAFAPEGPAEDELHVLVERRGSALLVHAGGSVDASNVAVWRRLIGEAAEVATAPGPLIIDTSGLEFMAICAFAVLVEESAGCRRRGIRLCLVSDQRIAARVVDAVGIDAALSFAATVDDILGAAPRDDPGSVRDG